MSSEEFYSGWTIGGVIGALVVVAVAVLLTTILVVARRIASLAGTALSVAGDIETRTKPIWAIGQVNQIMDQIVRTGGSIDRHAASIADALSEKTGVK